MTSEISLTLFGNPPWGFRCGGGSEHKQPLVVTRLAPGSLACKSGVRVGDQIKAVNGQFTVGWSQAQLEQAANANTSLHLVIVRQGAATPGKYQGSTVNAASMGSNFTPSQYTQNPKINASAKGFGAPAASFKVSRNMLDTQKAALLKSVSSGGVKNSGGGGKAGGKSEEKNYLMEQLQMFRKGDIILQQSISTQDKTVLMRKNAETGRIESVEENKGLVKNVVQKARRGSTISEAGSEDSGMSFRGSMTSQSVEPSSRSSMSRTESKSTLETTAENDWPAPPPVDFRTINSVPEKLRFSSIHSKLETDLQRKIDNTEGVRFGTYRNKPVVRQNENGDVNIFKRGSGSLALAAKFENLKM